MKNKLHGLTHSLTAVTLSLCMLLGISAPTVMAAAESTVAAESYVTSAASSYDEEKKEHESGKKAAEEISASITAWVDWLKDYANDPKAETEEVLDSLVEYLGLGELVALCNQLDAIYSQLDEQVTPEQKVRLGNKTYELTTRLQSIAAMATTKKLQPKYYLSIGDSTLSGYGLDDYVLGENNGEGQVLGTEAPVLLAQRLFGEDYENHFKKLDKGGLRIDDLLVWLGEEEYIDDFYIRYTMDANAVESETAYYQNLFKSEIEKADLITLALGGGNVSTFLGQQIKAMSQGQPLYEMDWSRYFPDGDLSKIKSCISAAQKLLEGKLPEIQGVAAEQLAPVVVESFLFGMVGYINNYYKVVERIHEINPDAHIVIVSFFNFADDMEIPVSIGDKTVNIPLGRMLGSLMDSCNASSLAYAVENRDFVTYVSISDTTTILDEQGLYDWESQLRGMITQTWLTHAGPEGHVYITDQIYNAITNEYTDGKIAREVLLAFCDYTAYLACEFGDELICAAGLDELINANISSLEDFFKEETAKLEIATEAVKTELEQRRAELYALISEKKDEVKELCTSASEFFNYLKK
ncbi:MAG: hypothetical protein IJX92_00425 [Clostridia bacterium]|nr:hypothetical protein [Clostridia bacterium]